MCYYMFYLVSLGIVVGNTRQVVLPKTLPRCAKASLVSIYL